MVNEYAETQLAQRASTVSGVALVNVFGSQKYAVRVQVDPNKLASVGVGLDEVQQRSRRATSTSPPHHGRLAPGAGGALQRTARARLTIAPSPWYRNGAPVKLDQVASVDSVENARGELVQRQARHRAGHPAPARHHSTPSRWWRTSKSGAAGLPGRCRRSRCGCSSTAPNRSANRWRTPAFTLVLAVVLVVLVIFLFLRNLSATIIPRSFCRSSGGRHLRP